MRSTGIWEISAGFKSSGEPGTRSSDLFRFNSCSGILVSFTSRRTDWSQMREPATSVGQWVITCPKDGCFFSSFLVASSALLIKSLDSGTVSSQESESYVKQRMSVNNLPGNETYSRREGIEARPPISLLAPNPRPPPPPSSVRPHPH